MAQRQYSFFFTYLCQVTTCQVTEGQAVGAVRFRERGSARLARPDIHGSNIVTRSFPYARA